VDEVTALRQEVETSAALELCATPTLKAPPMAQLAVLAKVTTSAQIEPISLNEDQNPDYTYIRESDGWKPFLVPGTYIKPLFTHPAMNGHRMFLLRMDAGIHFPEHPHDGIEECLMLSGDMETEGVVLGPGDYVRARAGTQHGGLYSRNGCVCLLVMSQAA
jgi:hypothetical protein